MANTLDQKQEVIPVELTKYGRKLLGLGHFKPHYFSFFDDSVIYDNSYSGISENINEIQDRILNKSITISSLNLIDDIGLEKLGTSDTISDYSPAWSIKALNGKINFTQESSSYYKKFFNIENITYTVSLETDEKIPYYESDYLLLDLQELNLSDDMSNFEIELVTFDELSGGKSGSLERILYFTQAKNNIIDDIIYEEGELPSRFFEPTLDKSDTSYYLDVLVDDEIDTEFITSTEKTIQEKIDGTYTRISAPVKQPC